MALLQTNFRLDYKIIFIIFIITFSVFIFTSHGHRISPDEYYAFNQAEKILIQKSDQNFISGITRPGEQETGTIIWSRPACKDALLCSISPVGYAASILPFVIIEENFHIIPNFVFISTDFDDSSYVSWRNSISPEETFTFLFFGPLIASFSICVVFLIARTYNYSVKTSTIISFFYGFSTIAWAYSDTGFSIIESTLLVLIGFLFFRKFQKNNRMTNLFLSGLSLGFGITVRYDTLIFAAILFLFIVHQSVREEQKIKKIGIFLLPLILFIITILYVNEIRFGSYLEFGYGSEEGIISGHTTPLHVGIYGLLFSPGAGIFIFSPILLTIIISFHDFFKNNRRDLILFLSYFAALLIFFGSYDAWHGFVGWSSRYMIPIIPFLILPLGASIERRWNKPFGISLIILGMIGSFFSFIWLIQDVSWFVWGLMGGDKGLYSLGIAGMHPLNFNPIVFWTFEHSQLTNAIVLAFTHLQIDLYLFKVLGTVLSISILSLILVPSSILLIKILRIRE